MGCICAQKGPPIRIQSTIQNKSPLCNTRFITEPNIQFKNCYRKITKDNLINIFEFLTSSELKETRKCSGLFQKLVLDSEFEYVKKNTGMNKKTMQLSSETVNHKRRPSMTVYPQRNAVYKIVVDDTLIQKTNDKVNLESLMKTEMQKHNITPQNNKKRAKSQFYSGKDEDKQSKKAFSPQKHTNKKDKVNQTIAPQNNKMLNMIWTSKTMKNKNI